MRRPRFGARLFARLAVGGLLGGHALRLDGERPQGPQAGRADELRGPSTGKASPLGEVVLLLQGLRLDRLDLMQEIYGPIFQDVLHLFWVKPPRKRGLVPGDPSTQLAEVGAAGLELEEEEADAVHWEDVQELVAGPGRQRELWVYGCPRLYRPTWQTHCLPDILDTILERHPSTKGVFACHMDLWFHPFQLLAPSGLGLRLDALWQLGPGLAGTSRSLLPAHFCFSEKRLLDADGSWHWSDGLKNSAWEASAAAQEALGYGRRGPPAVCLGWVDAFYLPQPWANLTAVASHFGEVWHEVAFPTIFNILVRFTGLKNQTFPKCWGDAGKGGGPVVAADLRDNVCGHHLDLKSDRIRHDWITMMRGETQAALRTPR